MNLQEADILQTLIKESFINQRILAETSGHSLGVVNKSLKKNPDLQTVFSNSIITP